MIFAVGPPIRLERSSSPRLEDERSANPIHGTHLQSASDTVAGRISGNGRDFKIRPLKSGMDCGMILNTRIIPPLGISTFRNTISSSAPVFTVSTRDVRAGQTAGRLYERASNLVGSCARELMPVIVARFFSRLKAASWGAGGVEI